jgi:hypothetical protein
VTLIQTYLLLITSTDINISPGRMEHMSTFVREIENDLSHGDNMFSMDSFTNRVNDTRLVGPSWLRSYGSWIYNYLCNQYLSPLNL